MADLVWEAGRVLGSGSRFLGVQVDLRWCVWGVILCKSYNGGGGGWLQVPGTGVPRCIGRSKLQKPMFFIWCKWLGQLYSWQKISGICKENLLQEAGRGLVSETKFLGHVGMPKWELHFIFIFHIIYIYISNISDMTVLIEFLNVIIFLKEKIIYIAKRTSSSLVWGSEEGVFGSSRWMNDWVSDGC